MASCDFVFCVWLPGRCLCLKHPSWSSWLRESLGCRSGAASSPGWACSWQHLCPNWYGLVGKVQPEAELGSAHLRPCFLAQALFLKPVFFFWLVEVNQTRNQSRSWYLQNSSQGKVLLILGGYSWGLSAYFLVAFPLQFRCLGAANT